MFDPPHWGHYFLGVQALEEVPGLEEVILMPAWKHHWKPQVAPAKDRYTMAKLLSSGHMSVSRLELERQEVSYTYDTVRLIKSRQDVNVYWIIGSDNVPFLDKWYRIDELMKEVTFIIFPRPGHPLSSVPEKSIIVRNTVHCGISSSLVRERVARGRPITGMVPESVESYIRSKKLYEKI